MSDTIQYLRQILEGSIDSTPERVSIYFKTSPGDYAEHDRFMGITVPVLRKIAKRFMAMSLEDLGLLIQSKINEERLLTLRNCIMNIGAMNLNMQKMTVGICYNVPLTAFHFFSPHQCLYLWPCL